jgi:tetratricopeptide (TPR) repeat protein/DNA-binding transcriptional regulator YiaG
MHKRIVHGGADGRRNQKEKERKRDVSDLSHLDTFGELLRAFRKRQGLTQQQVATGIGMHRNAIGHWELGDFLPESKGTVLALARFLHLNAPEARQFLEASFITLAPPWVVPSQRNPFFTGRREYLQRLHRCLTEQQPAYHPTSYALSGLGGIGKTQLALEYAYQYALDYTAVLWVHAENMETIITSFLAIAELLHVPEHQDMNQQSVIKAVQHWLTTHHGWLLIWDNLEDVALLQRYLPPVRQGAVLITTRRQALGSLALSIELPTMTQEEGRHFLLRRARLVEVSSDETLLQAFCQHAPQEYAAAQEIVTLLGGLPLALDQVGAYLEETACRLQDYLHLSQMRQGELLVRRGKMVTDHPLSVATTLSLSFQRVEEAHAAATDLLRLCAFLHPDAIPDELILRGTPLLGERLGSVASDPLQWHEIISTLLTYSLIQRQAQEQTFSLHRLVQAVMKETMDAATRAQWSTRAILAVNAAFPEMKFANWQACERFLPHAQVCLLHSHQSRLHLSEAGRLFYEAGSYLLERGRYEEAESFLRQALAIRKPQQEHDPIAFADSLNRQAALLRLQGKYQEAEHPFQEALVLYESQLPPGHPSLSSALNDLALLSLDRGKYDQAEALYQRILTFSPWEALGPNTLDNIARLYHNQGKYEQAEVWYQRAVQKWEQQLGPPHPDMAFSLNNLATLYMTQGRYEQAEPLFQRSLHIRQQTLGPQHPRTATGLHNLAKLLFRQGKDEQAASLAQRALHIFEQQVGTTHPSTANCLVALATITAHQGNDEQAEQGYQRALMLLEQSLGPEHTKTAECLTALAALSRKQGKSEQAECLYLQALRIFESAFGSSHPAVAQPLNGLATLAWQRGQYDQAEILYQRALTIRQEHLGPCHPDVAETLHDLAACLHQQHQPTEARSRYQQALAIRERALGGEHPETEETRHALEGLVEEMRQTEEAVAREMAIPEVLCACGCGHVIERSRSRGEPRRFFSQACRQRFYRHTLEKKRHTNANQ